MCWATSHACNRCNGAVMSLSNDILEYLQSLHASEKPLLDRGLEVCWLGYPTRDQGFDSGP